MQIIYNFIFSYLLIIIYCTFMTQRTNLKAETCIFSIVASGPAITIFFLASGLLLIFKISKKTLGTNLLKKVHFEFFDKWSITTFRASCLLGFLASCLLLIFKILKRRAGQIYSKKRAFLIFWQVVYYVFFLASSLLLIFKIFKRLAVWYWQKRAFLIFWWLLLMRKRW